MRLDGLHAAVHMGRRVGVEADVVGAGLGERLGQGIDGLHHQVHVDGHGDSLGGLGVGLQSLTDHGAESQVGNVMVVHDVEVDPVCSGSNDAADFVTQAGEVGGQNRGGDAESAAHLSIVAVSIAPCRPTTFRLKCSPNTCRSSLLRKLAYSALHTPSPSPTRAAPPRS
ncbi:hypothetical protein D3C80_1559100 [compost metagenome]